MAERRMFAKTIIDSDAFLDMPLTTQALYFHLSMRADDDGFINNPKKIARMVGCSEDDLKLLLAKSFIIVFESGVVVIKHWKIHNYIQSDRYKPTVYEEEKSMLDVKKNKAYTMLKNEPDTECIQDVYKPDTQVRLGKVRDRLYIDEALYIEPLKELQPDDISSIISTWNSQSCTQPINSIPLMRKRYNDTRECINNDLEGFLNIISGLDKQAFFRNNAKNGNRITYDWFVNPNNFLKIVEGNYTDEHKQPAPATKQNNNFANFHQRDYSKEQMEKIMFG